MVSGLAIAFAGLSAQGAGAQTIPPAPADDDAGVFVDDAQPLGSNAIIVTAQRREQNLQDVPVAISALNEDYLRERNVTSIDQIGSVAPNVLIQRGASNSSVAQISIRGATTINPSLTWEPTAGIYLDGVYLGKAQGGFFDVADIERIEVLRGPQGTLYGRNTLSGAINIVTAKPTGDFGGEFRATYGNYDYKQFRGSVDFPEIADLVAVKLSGQIGKRDGIYEVGQNPFPEVVTAFNSSVDAVEDLDSQSFMLQARIQPSGGLTLDYAFDYSELDQRPAYTQAYSFYEGNIFDPGSPLYQFGGAFFPYDKYVSSEYRKTALINTNVYEDSRVFGHSLTAALDLGDIGELKSITAYRSVKFEDLLDLDGSPLPLAQSSRDSDYHAFSQEVQLAGNLSVFNYIVGAYYSKDKASTFNPQAFFGAPQSFDSRYRGRTTSYAAFGQVDVELTDRLTLTGGLRYTEETKTIARYYRNFADPSDSFAYNIDDIPGEFDNPELFDPTRVRTSPDADFNNLTPTAIIAYEPMDNVNVYAKYAKGFKSGGFNGESGSVDELATPYLPEKLTSYEIGVKTELLDGRLRLNMAAFQNDTTNLQLSVFTGQGAVSSIVQNAGKARVRGFELEATGNFVDWLTVSGSFAYLDPEYQEFIENGENVADNRAFSSAPEFTASASVDWRVFELGSGARLNIATDVNYTDEYFIFPFALEGTSPGGQNAFNTLAPARTVVDLRAILSRIPVGENDLSVTAFARNLFDIHKELTFIDFGASFGGITTANWIAPRTYGLTVGVQF
ncbi:TonB-dependent receptor [Croceicoccus sp. F390]|uniref:TonB-dependent receptor n=1 Tax=Croceicoccus esteveae TaxID=3075597 RepID=A0ABU2ZFE3_9SPHN|nr:TonB-dependent receptor [Croceicoccus sp. F390]MDT0575317.1 TonB-dependent receptor [Croceicoccus sp. F390]